MHTDATMEAVGRPPRLLLRAESRAAPVSWWLCRPGAGRTRGPIGRDPAPDRGVGIEARPRLVGLVIQQSSKTPACRDGLCLRPTTPAFLLSGGGTRLNHTNTSTTFAGLLEAGGIATPPGRRRPRLYDLRHSFAVATLIDWHAEGADVQARLPVLSTWMGHVRPSSTYWYLQAAPQLLAVTALRLERYLRRPAMTALAPILQAYFTQRLAQRQASAHTVASYRDTFSLLLRFAQQQLGTPPSRLDLADVDAALVGAFLDHLETGRGNSAATRNNRLAAVHSLFSYAALRCPEHAATIARVLAIPPKRTDTTIVCFLTRRRGRSAAGQPGPGHPTRPTRPRCCCSSRSKPGCASPS